MQSVGNDRIDAAFVGNMGIKTIAIGDEIIYQRAGAYAYVSLETQ